MALSLFSTVLICSTSCALCSMKAWKSAALRHELAGWNGVLSRPALQRWQARPPLPPPSSGGAPSGGFLLLLMHSSTEWP